MRSRIGGLRDRNPRTVGPFLLRLLTLLLSTDSRKDDAAVDSYPPVESRTLSFCCRRLNEPGRTTGITSVAQLNCTPQSFDLSEAVPGGAGSRRLCRRSHPSVPRYIRRPGPALLRIQNIRVEKEQRISEDNAVRPVPSRRTLFPELFAGFRDRV